jgi:ribulose bisphosphate carboxylase small subunit
LSDIERIIEDQLVDNWVVRIEYTKKIEYMVTSWQQWGETFFNITDASGVIKNIISCHKNNPQCAMRLHAEKYSPRSYLYFWLCQAKCISNDIKAKSFKIVN